MMVTGRLADKADEGFARKSGKSYRLPVKA
jgi:hypothetical protein